MKKKKKFNSFERWTCCCNRNAENVERSYVTPVMFGLFVFFDHLTTPSTESISVAQKAAFVGDQVQRYCEFSDWANFQN